MTQELLDAVAPGNKAVWDRYLAPECIYAAEDGRTLTKAQLLEELSPLPSGYKGSIRVANPQVRVHGDTAVITYDAMEDLEIHGQALATRFHTTDTWLRRDGRWRMIASQVSVIPSEPKAVTVDPRILDAYVGTYTLAPGVEYKVRREGNRLIGQRTGRPEEELFARDEWTFFRKGSRGEKVFVRGSGGKVQRLIDRRDNNDLVWRRATETSHCDIKI